MWQDSPALTLFPVRCPTPHQLSVVSINLHAEGEEGQELYGLLPRSHPSLEVEDDAMAYLSSSGIWVPDHIALHSSTSATHHNTLVPCPLLLSFLGTPVLLPVLTFTV